MQEIKKIFDRHTGSSFQSISGAISFQTSMIAAVAFWTVRVDADMFDQPAAHMISLMDFMPGDDRTAQVWIQQKDQCTVKLRMIPELQIRRCSGVMFQMARIRKSGGKI